MTDRPSSRSIVTLDELAAFAAVVSCDIRSPCSAACWNHSDDVMRCVVHEDALEESQRALPDLLKIARKVADRPARDSNGNCPWCYAGKTEECAAGCAGYLAHRLKGRLP